MSEEPNAEYPLGGSVEPYDAFREAEMARTATDTIIYKNPAITANEVKEAVRRMGLEVRMEEGHHYVRLSDGMRLAGVSTISGIMPKPWLAAWGAKEAVKFLGYTDYDDLSVAEDTVCRIASMDAKQFVVLLKEAKGACGRKKDKALTDGTSGHSWLESFVQAKIEKENPPEVPAGFLERPLSEFVLWQEQDVKEWILSEAMVASPEFAFAGTLDAVALMSDGKLAIVDFKFAQHVSEDYYLQTAGYAIPFEKYGIGFGRRVIVRLPKTETKEEYDKETRKYSTVKNAFEAVDVPTDYGFDRRAFLAARDIYRWINQFRKD